MEYVIFLICFIYLRLLTNKVTVGQRLIHEHSSNSAPAHAVRIQCYINMDAHCDFASVLVQCVFGVLTPLRRKYNDIDVDCNK